jgi:hypothetical protein
MKNLTFASLTLVSSLSVLSLGCGSSSGNDVIGGAGCGVGPCGGDIVGTWNATGLCVDKSVLMSAFVSGLMDGCSGASLADTTSFTPSGTLTFNSDLSYDIALTLNGSVAINVPPSCFQGATCAQFGAALQDAVANDPSIQSVACTGNCVCTFVEAPMQDAERGTYLVSGSSLLTTPASQTAPDTTAFCVKGTTSTFTQPAMARMETGVIAIVAQKQ